ncbi:efflux RND transporter periplasmic adaptor subunit [Alteromonas sediminis]|uniref:Efflux RND transporter periplasmic adaptor subunit n=1 Tax=Alteromonas sediminis TaxID=2259342 RepID=A0A3N5YM75_9ALTE|nr:efflux RND transporter periplasmic adaptor subunit [Alteromonas sediminis]RPJ66391.1 efflux RND transporter periplasmic adaptor subunit [Alteromonas sediminis]
MAVHASFSKLLAVFLAGFFALGLLLIAAGKGAAFNDAEPSMTQVVNVEPISLQTSYAFMQMAVGRVEPMQTTQLSFDRGGQLSELLVEEGSLVQKGQVLARLEQSRLNAQIAQANSTVDRTKAEARLADITRNRVAELVSKGLDSSQALDEANARLDVANAVYAQALASLEALDVEKQKSHIYAPYDGFIVKRYHDAGAVLAGTEPVFTIKTDKMPEIRVALSEKLASQVSIGDTVAFDNNTFSAELVRFVQRQDVRTRTQDAIFIANSEAWQPLDGEMVNLIFRRNIEEVGAWIPISALSSGIRGMWMVYAVNGEGIIESRMVSLLHTDGNSAYVSGALKDGDKIVTAGTHKLVPGQQVQISKG